MKKKIIIITTLIMLILIIIILYTLYYFNYIPHKKYANTDFNIKTYKSNIDKDNDGIDDQTDILNNAKNYIEKSLNIGVNIMKQVILMMNMEFVLM